MWLLLACTAGPHTVEAPTDRSDSGSDSGSDSVSEGGDSGSDSGSGTGDSGGDSGTSGTVLTATNPVITGDHPDPHVLRTVEADGSARYWLTHTVGSGSDIPVYTSTDLLHWSVATSGLFGVAATPGGSIELHGGYYCHVWAPQLVELGPSSYLLSFTAVRYTTPQATCPAYAEDGGVYLAWSASPTGPFADADHPWEPLPAGAHITDCPLRDELPRSLYEASGDCQGTWCHHIVRLDSDVWRDPDTGRWWLSYAWFTNTPPVVDWEYTNHGEHTSLVELDAADPFTVLCDAAVPQVLVGNPHDADTLSRLGASCDRCGEMLSMTRGRYDEEMTRDGYSWGVNEGPTLFRRGGLVYALLNGSAWDSAYYHYFYVAAPTVEALSVDNPDRLVGRVLIPSDEQSFGHGTVVLGPDGDTLYLVHHRLRHDACRDTGDCSRDVWVTRLAFEDHGDGRGDVWITPVFPAEAPTVEVRLP